MAQKLFWVLKKEIFLWTLFSRPGNKQRKLFNPPTPPKAPEYLCHRNSWLHFINYWHLYIATVTVRMNTKVAEQLVKVTVTEGQNFTRCTDIFEQLALRILLNRTFWTLINNVWINFWQERCFGWTQLLMVSGWDTIALYLYHCGLKREDHV